MSGTESTFIQCSKPGCDRPIKSRGMCGFHYGRWYRTEGRGKLATKYGPRNESARSKLDRNTRVMAETGCWEKIGWVTGFGYGQIWMRGKFHYMHVLRYVLHVAPVPDGFDVDHLCENHACSNPRHLEHIPHRLNTLRGRGHPAVAALKASGCLCWSREAESCPDHGLLHWRPDWRECLDDVASRRVYELEELVCV